MQVLSAHRSHDFVWGLTFALCRVSTIYLFLNLLVCNSEFSFGRAWNFEIMQRNFLIFEKPSLICSHLSC